MLQRAIGLRVAAMPGQPGPASRALSAAPALALRAAAGSEERGVGAAAHLVPQHLRLDQLNGAAVELDRPLPPLAVRHRDGRPLQTQPPKSASGLSRTQKAAPDPSPPHRLAAFPVAVRPARRESARRAASRWRPRPPPPPAPPPPAVQQKPRRPEPKSERLRPRLERARPDPGKCVGSLPCGRTPARTPS